MDVLEGVAVDICLVCERQAPLSLYYYFLFETVLSASCHERKVCMYLGESAV